MRKKALICLLMICGLVAGMGTAGDDVKEDDIIALVHGNVVYVRSWFSSEEDVVIKIGLGSNRQIAFLSGALVPHDAPMTLEGISNGALFHACGDDATPWNLNGTYIGGNHGSSDVLRIVSPGHGLTVKDIGSAWVDEDETAFYLLRTFGPDEFLVISDNQVKAPFWKFVRSIKGHTLSAAADQRTVNFSSFTLTQLTPACRINSQQLLLDGRVPFPAEMPVRCSHLDIIEDYDIICPDSVLESAKANPGKEVDWVAKDLDAVVNNRILYRLLPQGTCVVRHQSTAKRDFNLGYMGFIQSSKLHQDKFDTHEYYIPKTLPFKVGSRAFDFSKIQDFSFPLEDGCFFSFARGNIADPDNLPDRYIQFLGMKEEGKTKRKIGYALGYSLTEGITRPELRAKNVDQPVWIWRSSKTYPQAIDAKMGEVVKAGTVFDCTAYRQYFNAAATPDATCVYGHYEGSSFILYADYHRSVGKDIIPLPDEQVGRKVEIVEKTPSATILSGDTVPANGIVLSVKDGYGYVVLKID